MMKTVLTGRSVEITPAIRQLVERRLGKLERVLHGSVVSAQVVLSIERYRHLTEITIHARGGHMLHAVAEASTWPLSIKEAVEKLDQQADRLKTRWDGRRRRAVGRGVAAAASVAQAEPVGAVERRPQIVRASRYAVKPMTVEDAALEVTTGSDTFLVFRNAGTDSINIVYRRKDGRLGLIEPKP